MKKPQHKNGSIDKGIPIPGAWGSDARRKYPWIEMEVGDSFIMHDGSNCAWANIKFAPKHWVTRKTPEGLRVWRDK